MALQDSHIKQVNVTSEAAAKKPKENNVSTILGQLVPPPSHRPPIEPMMPSASFIPTMTTLCQRGQHHAQLPGADEAMQQMFNKEKKEKNKEKDVKENWISSMPDFKKIVSEDSFGDYALLRNYYGSNYNGLCFFVKKYDVGILTGQ